MVDLVYDCAKFKYECGNYTEASEYLYFYRVLVSDTHSMCTCIYMYMYMWKSTQSREQSVVGSNPT